MGTMGWLLMVAVGIALGFSVGRFWPGSAARLSELEQERDAARVELETYREEVSTHFARTAHLFDKVTADYRGLYEHLAMGSRQLGAIRGESVELPLAQPEGRRLARTEPEPPAAEWPTAESPAAASPIAESPVPADDLPGTEAAATEIPPTDAPTEPRLDEPGTPARAEDEQPDRRTAQER